MIFSRRLFFYLSLIATAFPCYWLITTSARYDITWDSHLWLIGYIGEYFHQNGSMPMLLNTINYTHITTPLFYGTYFYPIMGFFSALTGPHLALRILSFTALYIQFLSVFLLVKKIGGNEWMALGLGCLVNWAIYPMTNLYNRGAITEFFAVIFLTIAICAWMYSTLSARFWEKLSLRVTAAFLFTLIVGTHPITAFYGAACVAFIAVITAMFRKSPSKADLLSYIVALAIIGFGSLPIYSLSQNFREYMPISGTFSTMNYIEGIDELWVRLWPLPLDLRSLSLGTTASTPYLDGQVNSLMTLFFFIQTGLIYLEIRKQHLSYRQFLPEISLLAACAGVFIYLLRVSVDPKLSGDFDNFFHMAQFAYRFVTYPNLAVLTGVLVCLKWMKDLNIEISRNKFASIGMIVLVFLAGQSGLQKLSHVSAVLNYSALEEFDSRRTNKDQLLKITPLFIGISDYMAAHGMNQDREIGEPQKTVDFPIGEGGQFGQIEPIEIEISEPTWVGINEFPFPWNTILVNGQPIKRKELTNWENRTYMFLPAGKHTINSQFTPDAQWVTLRQISILVMGFSALWVLVFLAGKFVQFQYPGFLIDIASLKKRIPFQRQVVQAQIENRIQENLN